MGRRVTTATTNDKYDDGDGATGDGTTRYDDDDDDDGATGDEVDDDGDDDDYGDGRQRRRCRWRNGQRRDEIR
jgi:hypothetical protein